MRAQGRQEVVDADGPGIGIVSTRTIYRANRRSFAGTSSAPWRLSGGPTADARSFRRALKHERRELPPPWRFPHHIAKGPQRADVDEIASTDHATPRPPPPRVDHIPESPGRDSSDGGARHGVARTPLVQECARSGIRVQVRTGNPFLAKGEARCGNCCVAASCTVIRLS